MSIGQVKAILANLQSEIELIKSACLSCGTSNDVRDELLKIHAEIFKRQSEYMSSINSENSSYDDTRLPAFFTETLAMSVQLMDRLNEINKNARPSELQYFRDINNFIKELVQRLDPKGWSSLERKFVHDTSGHDGAHGHDGRNGFRGIHDMHQFGHVDVAHAGKHGHASNGKHGKDGNDGEPGSNALVNEITLASVFSQNIILVSKRNTTNEAPPSMLPLYDSNVSVTLRAKGGKGGDGGDGGDGERGVDGHRGADAKRHAHGENGDNGGNGGHGGKGGHGGSAGDSCDIIVNVKDCDTDLLYFLEMDCSASRGGSGGKRGEGGKGGAGGDGGKSLEWTEGTGEKAKHHHEKGGRHGARGHNGPDGHVGGHGEDGRPGNTILRVCYNGGVTTQYQSLYRLQLVNYQPFTSNTGIVEPGQKMKIRGMNIENTGGMPSPSNGLMLSIKQPDTFSLQQISNRTIFQSIDLNSRYQFLNDDAQLEFTIDCFSAYEQMLNTALNVTIPVSILASLPRICKYLPNFGDNVTRSLRIQYPVDLSIIRGGLAMTADDTMPITLKLRNLSLVALGIESSTPRTLAVTVSILGAERYAELMPTVNCGINKDQVSYPLTSSVRFEIKTLEAQSEMEFVAFLSLNNTAPAVLDSLLYSQIPLSISLSLGDINNPTSSGSTIQSEVHHIQLAEVRKAGISSTANMLLVCNCTTSRSEIDHWDAMAKSLKLTLVVWNISVYNGFSFTYEHCNLMKDFQDGLIVFLNTPCHRADDPTYYPGDKLFMPINYLEPYELFEAARRCGIRTYIINSSESQTIVPLFPEIMLPTADFIQSSPLKSSDGYGTINSHLPATYEKVAMKASHVFSTPGENTMSNRLAMMQTQMSKVEPPSYSYFFRHELDVKKLGGSFLKHYQVGHVEIRQGLDITYAMMATRDSSVTSSHCDATADRFALLKLLPMKKKLMLFTEQCEEFIGNAILSDLIDEVKVHENHMARVDKLPAEKLDASLVITKVFCLYDYSKIMSNAASKALFMDIIIKFYLFTKFTESIIPTCFGSAKSLKALIQEKCGNMMLQHFPSVSEADFQASLKAMKVKLLAEITDIHMASSKLVDPYDLKRKSKMVFNHQVEVESHTIKESYAINAVSTNNIISPNPYFASSIDESTVISKYSNNPKYLKPGMAASDYLSVQGEVAH